VRLVLGVALAGGLVLLSACDDDTASGTGSTSGGSSGADETAIEGESSGADETAVEDEDESSDDGSGGSNHRHRLPRIEEPGPWNPDEPGLREPWVPRDHYRPPPIHVPAPRIRPPRL
jgi:hypothetical protein